MNRIHQGQIHGDGIGSVADPDPFLESITHCYKASCDGTLKLLIEKNLNWRYLCIEGFSHSTALAKGEVVQRASGFFVSFLQPSVQVAEIQEAEEQPAASDSSISRGGR